MVTIAKTGSQSDAEAGSIRWNRDYWARHHWHRWFRRWHLCPDSRGL